MKRKAHVLSRHTLALNILCFTIESSVTFFAQTARATKEIFSFRSGKDFSSLSEIERYTVSKIRQLGKTIFGPVMMEGQRKKSDLNMYIGCFSIRGSIPPDTVYFLRNGVSARCLRSPFKTQIRPQAVACVCPDDYVPVPEGII